ncbi:hypothetical protein [Bradyrhizobium sp. BR13661]|jgi:hypothetical protein|uniref:hypothetical protein n=1 Tax=Bradyrhizobium sp. BR13661 TaxID=2940622 RepID=UPI002475E00A|nr:hypothetical protein [Bradyrhizobium sp. BR13661]MDH6258064.1 outer membrane biosynthesis protein TonB [Bradyrhizobium sp. BR13661]
MELRKIIRTDIAASAIAHLTLAALIIVISEVRPFHPAPPETVAVDIVTPEQVKQEEAKAEEKAQEQTKEEQTKQKPPEPLPELKLPKLDFTDKDKPDTSPKPAAKEKAAEKPAQQQKPQPSQAAKQHEANAQSQPQQPQAQQPPPAMPQPQAAPPAYKQPEPDVTLKYGVILGLPPALPPAPKDAPEDDGGDAKDPIAAKLPPEVIAELRRHLRSCSKLPAGVAATDAVRIRLRAVMATDGTLARPPILIEAPPSTKGVAIVKSAMSALQECQPYKMLPPDKYAEWSVMDLSFTPRDFGGS